MGSTIKDHNRLALVDYVDSYFKLKPPDCRLFSQDGCQISIHKVKNPISLLILVMPEPGQGGHWPPQYFADQLTLI